MKAVLVIAVSSLPLIASAGADESSALAEELMEAMEKTAALMTEAMSWDNMKDEYTAIYTDVFTEEELTRSSLPSNPSSCNAPCRFHRS